MLLPLRKEIHRGNLCDLFFKSICKLLSNLCSHPPKTCWARFYFPFFALNGHCLAWYLRQNLAQCRITSFSIEHHSSFDVAYLLLVLFKGFSQFLTRTTTEYQDCFTDSSGPNVNARVFTQLYHFHAKMY